MADRTQPEVSVLIVNFHSTDRLRSCLEALAASTIADALQVIVVDNGTPGFDSATLERDDLTIEFLPQDHNTTFTGGNNIAFARATGRFVLMLNPDTRIDADALERAIDHMDDDAGLVALGAWFVDESGDFTPYYRRLPRLRDVPVALIPRVFDWTAWGRQYLMADATFDGPTDVEQPAGAFILIRHPEDAGELLDPGYLNFHSDVELCRSLLAKGTIRVEPDVRCYHERGGAGLITYDPEARSRLHADTVWGLRRYFQGVGIAGKVWLQIWIIAFWMLRIGQGALSGRGTLRIASMAARRSLAGAPPDYGRDAKMNA